MPNKSMNGAQAIVESLQMHGVEQIFGYPGGANMPILDALLDSPIEFILTRHEQGATHMGDGYARTTGRAGVVLVTSGPGATNAITGLLTSHMDSVPLIVLCGQTIIPNLGLDAFQEADVSGISFPVVKHSYLIKDPDDIPRIIKEAFHLAETGRPGPILIDIPKDISSAETTPDFNVELDLPGYTIPTQGDQADISAAAEMLSAAKKPVLLVGHGTIISGACRAVRILAEKMQIPVVTTLLGKGAFPEDHELALGMLGMHGTPYANLAVRDCDLIMSIGSRWDDRILGNPETFCQHAKKIHIDIDQAENGKLIVPDIFIHGDARLVVEELNALVSPGKTQTWVKHCAKQRKRHPLKYKKVGGLRSEYVLDRLNELARKDAIFTTDVGQHQMWAAQFIRTNENAMFHSSGGAGTMGFGFPAAIGAQVAKPSAQVIAICGDGGFQMTLCELATAVVNNTPVKVLVLDNRYLGMVRQWQNLFFDNRIHGTPLPGNPDFCKLAESYGAGAFRIRRKADTDKILKKALEYDGPAVIWAEVVQEDNVFPMIPPGKSYDEMILEQPTGPLEKPTGSA